MIDGLADWLQHSQAMHASVAHLPGGADHAADLVRWEAAVRSMGWQPIETAPKDGEFILVYGWHSRAAGYPGRQLVVRWDGRAWESADDGYGVYLTPTHWVQLPAPPALPKEGRE